MIPRAGRRRKSSRGNRSAGLRVVIEDYGEGSQIPRTFNGRNLRIQAQTTWNRILTYRDRTLQHMIPFPCASALSPTF
jgi:hypothetical protein